MKGKNRNILWITLGLAALLAVAGWGYKTLSAKYAPQQGITLAADTATDFTVQDMNGQEAHLSDFFGKPIIVNLWATWCGPCQEELPYFESAYQQYGDEVNFLIVNLTDGVSDTVSDVETFIAQNGYTFPVYCDTQGSASDAYVSEYIPVTVMIRADGSLLGTQVGAVTKDSLNQAIEQLLGGDNA